MNTCQLRSEIWVKHILHINATITIFVFVYIFTDFFYNIHSSVLVIVKSRCEYNTAVISQVRGAAEDAGNNRAIVRAIRDLTGFYPMH